ncbi:MAG: histidinol-phosphate transaminase [Myxococcales bacterium]|nr:histidinol-phosphate transaminase [Myxococcales bacterium]
MSLEQLVKPWVRSLRPYEPGKPVEELERELGIQGSVKLASNENALGPSPRALAALREAVAGVHRYPDGHAFALRRKLSERLGVAENALVLGNGADELLELIAKTLVGPGDEVVYPWPSFAMYPIVVRGMGGKPVPVPLDADLQHDFDGLLRAITGRTKVVMLCNPNNPTGTTFGAEAFDDFVRRLPGDVVLAVDEVYFEYARRDDFPDTTAWIARRPGTIALRSLSKIYGLAGLRVGYGITDPEFAGYLERVRHPFNLNLLAQAAAVAALDDDEHLERSRQLALDGIAYLTRELGSMGIEVVPSEANFVLVRAGADVYEPLLREGVIVRPMAGFGLAEYVRVTVGLPEENERLVKALRRLQENA